MYLGVDVGGTNTKIGIVSRLGRVVDIDSFKTMAPISADDLIEKIISNIYVILQKNNLKIEEIEGVGVGIPGVVDDNGIIVQAVNLGWKDVDFKSKLETALNKKVVVGNDANCAILAEWAFGCAKGVNSAILITLGTGIGSGIILNGKLYNGVKGMGGECGHMVIVHNGIPCNCGNRGCWEKYASAKALASRTEEVAKENSSSALNAIISKYGRASAHTCFEGARQNDKASKMLVNEYVDYVVCGLINLTQIFHPEMFILGGGVAKEGPAFIKMVDDKLNGFLTKNKFEPKVAIKRPVLENNAGIVGAACLAMEDK